MKPKYLSNVFFNTAKQYFDMLGYKVNVLKQDCELRKIIIFTIFLHLQAMELIEYQFQKVNRMTMFSILNVVGIIPYSDSFKLVFL